MSLPKIYAPLETVTVGGETFELRVVTRAEQARFQKMINDKIPEDELEIAVIAVSTDTPTDEARAWYEATPAWAVQELIGHIQRVSRLDEGAQKSGG